MDKITEVFFNWQVLLISFAAFAVLSMVTKIGTRKEDGKIVGGWARNKWFRMFKPAYPYALTLGLVFIPGVPLPAIVGKTIAVKVLYGVYAGWLSDKSYQVIKSVLVKAGVSFGKS